MVLNISPVASIDGHLRPPSDKSLTHRAFMLAAVAQGRSVVANPLRGEDCEATLRCLAAMGLSAEWLDGSTVALTPASIWRQPAGELDCGNSGTTMRLLSGLVASRSIEAVMVGDASLSRRPMRRIAEPLRMMGAVVEGETPPIRVRGTDLTAIDYASPVASAQIKSCVLFAGLRASGVTSVTEPTQSRDHTERMLTAMGCRLEIDGNRVALEGGQQLQPFEFRVPGDISSAAFFLVAAAMLPASRLVLGDVSVNPSRTGILDVLKQCGAAVQFGCERTELGEPVNDLEVVYAPVLKPFEISGALVPRLIDELPVLAVLATRCEGTSVIRDAGELRVKESDRIELVADCLRRMGARVETFSDGMTIEGPVKLRGARIDAKGDHRIAMAFAVAGLSAEGDTAIDGAEAIATSYPEFVSDLQKVCVL